MLKSKIEKHNPENLDSNYGFVNGLYSPSESSQVFEYWFKSKERVIKNSIHKISEIFARPIITKYLKNHIKLDYLYKIFPTALFVIVKRDILYNAQSVVYGYQHENEKIRVLPSSQLMNKGSDNMELIVKDIMEINKNIDTFLDKNNPKHIVVDYDEIDKNYKSIIKSVKNYYQNLDIFLGESDLEKYRSSIKLSRKKKLKDSELRRLKFIIEKYSNESS